MSPPELPAFPWERAIRKRALAAGLTLPPSSVTALAGHAVAVLAGNARLHLTSITDPETFVERHIGEAFEGAALLPETATGSLVDLGSGNGYPGIPLALARPGLTPTLVEASTKKAAFLRAALVAAGAANGRVVERQVVRAADLQELPAIDVLATRAMGGWERIVPKLLPCLAEDGVVLLWASMDAEAILTRVAWRRLRVVNRRSLPGRQRSLVYKLQF